MAARGDTHLHRPFDDARKVDFAGKLAQTRTHALNGLVHPRFQIVGMQRIEQKQATRNRIVAEPVDGCSSGPVALEDDLHDALEARSMHIHQKLHEFLARGFLRTVRHLIELRNQSSELSDLFLEFAAVSHVPPCL